MTLPTYTVADLFKFNQSYPELPKTQKPLNPTDNNITIQRITFDLEQDSFPTGFQLNLLKTRVAQVKSFSKLATAAVGILVGATILLADRTNLKQTALGAAIFIPSTMAFVQTLADA